MGVFRIALIEQGKKAARILQSEFKKSVENSVYYNIQDRPSVNVQVLRISSWLALPLLYPSLIKFRPHWYHWHALCLYGTLALTFAAK